MRLLWACKQRRRSIFRIGGGGGGGGQKLEKLQKFSARRIKIVYV